jgi:hypothetical protein
MQPLVVLACIVPAAALQIRTSGSSRAQVESISRRSAFQLTSAAAVAAAFPPTAFAAEKVDAKAVALLRETATALIAITDAKEVFVKGLVDGDSAAPQLPPAIPFATFQKLEKVAGPEFMEAAIVRQPPR